MDDLQSFFASNGIVPQSSVSQTPLSMSTNTSQSAFSNFDLYLFGQGVHDQIYNLLGAHCQQVNGQTGTRFAVWAPNAKSVHVKGNFNDWDPTKHALQPVGDSGIWECFVPDIGVGQFYKYSIVGPEGKTHEKSDPFGFAAELPPQTASIVSDLSKFEWNDSQWLDQRKSRDPLQQPVSIYEVHLGSWQKTKDNVNGWMNYRELAPRLVKYCQELGFTHLELMPISEHPYTGSWGYQTVGYYSVTSRYGSPEDFMFFVDYCHQHGIGVIIDWVPAHFPKDAHGLARFDGTALYEHADPKQGEHPDWGTLIFNYGRNEIRNFLTANALFWFDRYHIDGIRVDAVASMLYLDYSREEGEWIPNKYGGRENLEAIELLKQVNERVHHEFPGVMTIAEESTAWSGVSRPTYADGLGFSMKWNMGWMNDSLRYMALDPVHRKYHHDQLTFSLIYAFTENFVLPFSHDEVVHGKRSLLDQMPGDQWQKFANLRLLYTYMWTHPGKKLLFMSGELAQWDEWNCDQTIQWDLLKYPTHQGIQRLVGDLNRILVNQPSLYQQDFVEDGFSWINCDNYKDSTLSYLRKAVDGDDQLITVCNFTPTVREEHVIGVNQPGEYEVLLNSDSEYYAGTNTGSASPIESAAKPADGCPHSLMLSLPPLGALILKRVADAK